MIDKKIEKLPIDSELREMLLVEKARVGEELSYRNYIYVIQRTNIISDYHYFTTHLLDSAVEGYRYKTEEILSKMKQQMNHLDIHSLDLLTDKMSNSTTYNNAFSLERVKTVIPDIDGQFGILTQVIAEKLGFWIAGAPLEAMSADDRLRTAINFFEHDLSHLFAINDALKFFTKGNFSFNKYMEALKNQLKLDFADYYKFWFELSHEDNFRTIMESMGYNSKSGNIQDAKKYAYRVLKFLSHKLNVKRFGNFEIPENMRQLLSQNKIYSELSEHKIANLEESTGKFLMLLRKSFNNSKF